MRYWTYSEIKTKVRNDLGLSQETFVSDAEMLGYCNDGINDAEKEIHTIYEDYFLVNSQISIVDGTSLYSLPSDIFANKIRGVVYSYQNTKYPIYKIEEQDMFANIAIDDYNAPGTYRYILVNTSAAAGVQMRLVPEGQANETDAIQLWYIRNANRLTGDSDICDIPEGIEFIMQYMKKRCYEKEGHPNLAQAVIDLEFYRKQLIVTLSNMVPDNYDEINKDMTFYWETV